MNDLIVLPHWDTRSPAPYLISHTVTLSWHWANQSFPYPNSTEHLARKRQVSFLKSLGWLDQVFNPWDSDSPISQNGKRTLYSFGHVIWSWDTNKPYASTSCHICRWMLNSQHSDLLGIKRSSINANAFHNSNIYGWPLTDKATHCLVWR